MRKTLVIAAIVLVAALFIAPIATQAACMKCDHIFNSWFCFPGYPGRENCVDTLTDCAMSGAFCDQIIVVG